MVYRVIDSDGYWIEDVDLESVPMIEGSDGDDVPDPLYLNVKPSSGLYKPKWDGEKWIEGATAEYIDEVDNLKEGAEPTDSERIADLENTVSEIIMGGVL